MADGPYLGGPDGVIDAYRECWLETFDEPVREALAGQEIEFKQRSRAVPFGWLMYIAVRATDPGQRFIGIVLQTVPGQSKVEGFTGPFDIRTNGLRAPFVGPTPDVSAVLWTPYPAAALQVSEISGIGGTWSASVVWRAPAWPSPMYRPNTELRLTMPFPVPAGGTLSHVPPGGAYEYMIATSIDFVGGLGFRAEVHEGAIVLDTLDYIPGAALPSVGAVPSAAGGGWRPVPSGPDPHILLTSYEPAQGQDYEVIVRYRISTEIAQ